MKLDKSKPYGEVCNDSQGRRYEQGGVYFNAEGNVFGEKLVSKSVEKRLAVQKGASAEDVSDQLAAQLAG